MDPFTLFALATGAVEAVKKGCALYKDIKGVAGNVKEIINDLDKQFFNKYPGGKAPKEAIKQFNEEKTRIKELGNKKPDDIYVDIGEQLGAYYENYAKCVAIFEEEEAKAKNVYAGDTSLGKRALQRVLMRKKLEQMAVELREVMVYQSPPELGSLYSDVSAMMDQMMQEQKIAMAKKAKEDAILAKKRKAMRDRYFLRGLIVLAFVIAVFFSTLMMAFVIQDRIAKYPHLGTGWIPEDVNKPKIKYIYVGR